ncbi:hypothetical protein PSAR109036_01635 [Psychrobacter arenosus]|uniref:hypothetical protein n=1 Tax=Psychrobacter arenosus TaxID=256326 RepID=UPI00191B7554|nr:hypothetical protein [Psychrobacter arenosus]
MKPYSLILSAMLISAYPGAFITSAHAADKTMPKPIVIAIIESRCSNPDPNPRLGSLSKPVLEYDCSEKYEDVDGDEQSMDYSLRLHPLFTADFNQDGSQDLAVEVESMGPLGGSVFSNSSVEYLLLDKKKHIIGSHEILLYAPFSEHIVTYDLVGKQIHYSAVPNFRSHPEAYDDNGELLEDTIEFTVNWANGSPISSYYRDNCQLARIKNKTLLNLNNGGARHEDIDIHDYTQVITESVQASGLNIEATLSGCDLSTVYYEITPQQGKTLPVFSEVLATLIPLAQHSQQLKALQALEQRSELKFAEDLPLSKRWQAIVHVDRKEKTPNVRIILEQTE